jgi:hypothetical protein
MSRRQTAGGLQMLDVNVSSTVIVQESRTCSNRAESLNRTLDGDPGRVSPVHSRVISR